MVPLLAISALSGTGKTTLLKQIIPVMQSHGIRCGLIKHSHHEMEIDKPGKDSYELRKAGAGQVIVASPKRWALMTETPDDEEVDLTRLASRMDCSKLDLILAEGFRDEPVHKILLHREATENVFPGLPDRFVIAVASDRKMSLPVPWLDLNVPREIAGFIIRWLAESKQAGKNDRQ